MTKYIKLIISPSVFFGNLKDEKLSNLSIFIIWLLSMISMTLSKMIVSMQTHKLGIFFFPIYIFILLILYYPLVYGLSYPIWIVGRGFKGVSKFIEIQNSFIYSLVPFIIYLPIALTFVIIGLIKGNINQIPQLNYITQTALWILSFRIMITGIAKFNKFNWIISLVNWFIVSVVITGLVFLIKH
jgi:hypothetical protein